MSSFVTVPNPVVGASFSRSTTLLYPPFYDSSIPYPLVVMLHHYAANGADVVSRLSMTGGPWFDDGCMILAPDGQLGGDAVTHYWDFFSGPTSADFVYIKAIIDEVIANGWNVDTSRIFVVGYSNGAFMAHQLVNVYPLTFTSGFSFSGSVISADGTAAMPVAVPFANYHGTNDGTVLYAGDVTGSLPGYINGNPYLSATDTASSHALWNALSVTTLPGSPYDSIDWMSEIAGAETDRYAIAGTGITTNNAVEHWKGNSTTHSISLSSTGGEIFYDWLMTYFRDVSYGADATTLDPTTISAAGKAIAGGTDSTTLDPTTLVATGSDPSRGSATITLDAATLAGTAQAIDHGAASLQLDDATTTATAIAIDHGAADVTLGDATSAATGGVVDHGVTAVQLDDAGSAATAQALVHATATAALADATLAATGNVTTGDHFGVVDQVLADATLAATARTTDHGAVTNTLGDAALAAAAATTDHGQAAIQLDDATGTDTGRDPEKGSLTVTLDDATLAATGGVVVVGSVGTLTGTLANTTAVARALLRGQPIPADAEYQRVRVRVRDNAASLALRHRRT